jgi:ATP-binding cassette subfamily B protein
MTDPSVPKQRLFVPKVLPTSPVDCGAAVLKSVLKGFRIPVSYEHLRQACRTQVDGTSIDGVEKLAVQLGLEAEQVMLPVDHLLLPKSHALPAIVLARQPDGSAHFVVAWRLMGPFVQVMDPSSGRRWPTRRRFLDEVYVHTFPIAAAAWREWAGSDEFCTPLRQRLAALKLDNTVARHLVDMALQDPGWRSLAALDAVTRMLDCIVRAGGLKRGREIKQGFERFFEQARKDISSGVPDSQDALVPPAYWSVLPSQEKDQLVLQGAVLVRIRGRRRKSTPTDQPAQESKDAEPESATARRESRYQPEREIWRLLRAGGLLHPAVLMIALILAAIGVTVEALLLQGVIAIAQELNLIEHRLQFIGGVLIFFFALLLTQLFVAASTSRLGIQFEVRLRAAFLKKIPRLGIHYFDRLLISDMTLQSYAFRQIYDVPEFASQLLQTGFQMILTALGIMWLDPPSTPLVIAATIFSVGVPFVTAPILIRLFAPVITCLFALNRFCLDSLLGLIPVQTHKAERAIQREHESALVEWMHAMRKHDRVFIIFQTVTRLVNTALAVLILFGYVVRGGEARNVLLLLYWTFNLPILGTQLAIPLRRYPIRRHGLMQMVEFGHAPEEALRLSSAVQETHEDEHVNVQDPAGDHKVEGSKPQPKASGLAILMENVVVQLDGQTILAGIDLSLKAGEHIAIVGPSGAGKSSLVGILLGWYWPTMGRVLVDGKLLTGQRVQLLRREIAWVDPTVQLWNRSLLYNLRYGSHGPKSQISQAIAGADLIDVLTRLPQGLQTVLGEGGKLVSGGEGQRVRMGRAMLHSDVRLAILDEPFRGLDRAKRHALLTNARQYWQDVTLICVTHDVGETRDFDRVLVIEEGRIVEDDAPFRLIAQPTSRYRSLLEAERAVRQGLWASVNWRRLWLEDKRLSERKQTNTNGQF